VISGRAAWNSEPPAAFKRIAATPSYVLWERIGTVPEDRHVLLEGTEAGAHAECAAPELRILTASPGRAALFPDAVLGARARWRPDPLLQAGESASQALRLPAGRWLLSLQYFSPFDLTLSATGFRAELPAALDGQRPNTISLANDGQHWPAGEIASDGGTIRFEIAAAEPSALQRLSGYGGRASLGRLVAVRAGQRRVVPLRDACGGWVDWYESPRAP